MTQLDLDHDRMESIGDITGKIVGGLAKERRWDGKPITTPGVYAGISLDDYHGKRDLFDGPSVSKSALKWLLPAHGGSPKAFWGRWSWNPDHIKPDSTPALDFGKAAHCLLLGDEVFEDSFVVRPETYENDKGEWKPWNANANACKEWLARHSDKTVITPDQIDRIRRIHADASTNEMVKLGVLNGRVERTICWKDQETGIWLKVRPDAMPNADGVFADLKTASRFDFSSECNGKTPLSFFQGALSWTNQSQAALS